MDTAFEHFLYRSTGAQKILRTERVQELWAGYGAILRVYLDSPERESVIVKHIQRPDLSGHPRGWNTRTSDKRKWKSYEIEERWYAEYAAQFQKYVRLPQFLGAFQTKAARYLVLEDLNAAGFPMRKSSIDIQTAQRCVKWLANFHARGLLEKTEGLWPVGTYWHLATRQDEWEAMPDGMLKRSATRIDAALNNCRYRTLLHGDAKLANFCFSTLGTDVAALDFQYIGAGCGMKDVAYFLSSCFNDRELEVHADACLETYFQFLREALGAFPELASAVEVEWRALYPLAWADFVRFLDGWAPGHYRNGAYANKMVRQAMAQLDVQNSTT